MADDDHQPHPCDRCDGLPGRDGCPMCHGTGLIRPLRHCLTTAQPESAKLHTLYLSRQHDGNYMLTAMPPKARTVRGSDHEDLYIRHGEPVGVRHLCPRGTMAIFGMRAAEMRPMEVRRVRVMGWVDS